MNLAAERFESGVSIVAGGSGALGSAICQALFEMGSDVALTYNNNKEKAERVVAIGQAAGRKVYAGRVDLTNDDAVRSFVDDVNQEFGGIHTAIYAAGPAFELAPIDKISPATFRDTVSTDLFGCYNFLFRSLDYLKVSRGVAVALATPAIRNYQAIDLLSSAPKAGVEQIIKGIASECGAAGVRANAVGVGLIRAGMVEEFIANGTLSDEHMREFAAKLPSGRAGTAWDVANAVAFLVSDNSSYTTGHMLMCDGGVSI